MARAWALSKRPAFCERVLERLGLAVAQVTGAVLMLGARLGHGRHMHEAARVPCSRAGPALGWTWVVW